jgi:non-specific serine/threonine protein kinase
VAPLRNNLPSPVNSFVGREAELRESARLLGTARLLTLTGPSGAGKSRLALQVAARLSPAQFADGAWLVELADLKDPSVLARAVASALGVHDEPTVSPDIVLRDYLRNRTLLLILDSCEHLVNACAQLTQEHAVRVLP